MEIEKLILFPNKPLFLRDVSWKSYQKVAVLEKVNPLPNDKILGLSKLKGIADDKIKVTENF